MEFLYAYYIAMVNIMVFKIGMFYDTAFCLEEGVGSLGGFLDFEGIRG